MIPEPYWTIAKHWLLAMGPAWLLLYIWQRYLTKTVAETSRAIWACGPGRTTAYDYLRTQIAAAYQALGPYSVRVILEEKHKQLRHELDSIRQVLDRRLQQIAAASAGSDGESLIDMIRGFKADVDRALEFGTLEDGFVDDTVQRKKAFLYIFLSLAGVVVLSAFNFGLLYLYFSESSEGQRIPFLGIELALALSLFLPGAEFCAGIGAKLAEEAASFLRYLAWAGIAMVLIAFGSWEFTIFYQLFDGQFEQMIAFERGGIMHQLTSVVGPGLTFLQALFGYMVMKHLGQWRGLRSHQTIREQIADANRFVGGLDSRYRTIERSAAAACHSLDEFANQLSGRGQAELPVASAIGEQREALRAAIDEVNPERWPTHTPGAEGEQQAVKAQGWVFAILALSSIGLFTYAAAPLIARSKSLDVDSLVGGMVIALGTSLACFVAGTHLFERVTVAYEAQSRWRDAISPRDVAYRLAAAGVLVVAIVGTLWIGFDVAGMSGIPRAMLLVVLLVGIAIFGSYHDLVAQGFVFLYRCIIAIVVFAVLMLRYFIWGLVIALIGLLAGLVHFLIAFIASPITLTIELIDRIRRRGADSSLQPRAASS